MYHQQVSGDWKWTFQVQLHHGNFPQTLCALTKDAKKQIKKYFLSRRGAKQWMLAATIQIQFTTSLSSVWKLALSRSVCVCVCACQLHRHVTKILSKMHVDKNKSGDCTRCICWRGGGGFAWRQEYGPCGNCHFRTHNKRTYSAVIDVNYGCPFFVRMRGCGGGKIRSKGDKPRDVFIAKKVLPLTVWGACLMLR